MVRPVYDVESYSGCRSVGYLIRRAHTLLMPRAEALFADAELTFSQWVVLMSLRDGAADTCAEIARHMNHDTGATTRLVDQLEKRGLVARKRSTADRRVVHLKLLPAGKAMARALTPRIVDFWNRVLADFTAAEAQSLITLLSRLQQRLEAEPAENSRTSNRAPVRLARLNRIRPDADRVPAAEKPRRKRRAS